MLSGCECILVLWKDFNSIHFVFLQRGLRSASQGFTLSLKLQFLDDMCVISLDRGSLPDSITGVTGACLWRDCRQGVFDRTDHVVQNGTRNSLSHLASKPESLVTIPLC